MTQHDGNGRPYEALPRDEAAEQCVLACFQWDDDLFDTVPLRTEHFYEQRHKDIFGVMLDLHGKGVPTDAVTIASALNDRNLLEDVGGSGYVLECMQMTPHAAHVEHYAKIIRRKARLRNLHGQCIAIARACLSGGVTWDELNDGLGDLRDLIDGCDSMNLKAVPIGEFIEAHPKLKPAVISGLIRQGETCNIIANPKVGKSWLSYDLALSIATGRNWLETFQTSPGRVLIIDNELHAASIAGRIPTVADALSIILDEYQDRVDVISLRGRLVDFFGIGSFIRRIKKGEYAAVIVDAFYRMLPQGTSENDNAQIAGVYNTIDAYAEQTGAVWFLIHHSSKGSQSEKRTTDVGAGAGSQSRAADCHLILREHEESGCVVLDAAVRSFPPVEPVVLQWIFPVWRPVQHLDPTALKGKLTRKEERQANSDAEGISKIADALLKGPASIKEIRRRTGGMGKDRVERLIFKLEAEGQVSRNAVIIRGNETHEYELTDNDD